MNKKWRKIGKPKIIFEKYGKFIKQQFFIPPGIDKTVEYIFYGQKSWVMIFPLTKAGDVIAIREFKQGANRMILNLPAGEIEKGETPRGAAIRELREETGFKAEKIIKLGSGFIAPRNSTTKYTLFLALDCRKDGGQTLENEFDDLEVKQIPLARWKKIISNPYHKELQTPYPALAMLWSEKYL